MKEKSNNELILVSFEISSIVLGFFFFIISATTAFADKAMMLNLNVSDVPEYLSAGEDRLPSKDSEQNNTNKIDKILDSCIAKDNSTAGMTNCIHESYELWDAELNTLYNQLKELLNQDQKKDLKQAQLEWIKYRDAEFKLIDSIYSSLQGTMFTPMRAGDRVEIVKKRALELESYIELIKLK